MPPTIRLAEPADRDVLFELLTQFATSFVPDRDAFEHSLTHLLDDGAVHLLVAEVEGKIVGYCLGLDHYTLYANGRVSWVEEIMIREDMRGQGIGRSLMNAFEEWSRSRSSRLVALATRRAAPFYAALDYEESATYFRKLLD